MVLIALIVTGLVGHGKDSNDANTTQGVIGSTDYDRGSGVAGALTPPLPGPSLDPVDAGRYVGRYRRTTSEGTHTIEVGLINDGDVEPHWTLIVLDGAGPVQKLVPVAGDTFALQLAPRQRVLFRRLGDSVSAVSVRRGRDTTWVEREHPLKTRVR